MILSSPNSLGGFVIKRAKGLTVFYAKSMVQKICRTKKANVKFMPLIKFTEKACEVTQLSHFNHTPAAFVLQ